MAGTGVGKFSTTAANNTGVQTTNWAEGMAPSDVNNAARETMAHIRAGFNGIADGYVEYGDSDGVYTVAKIDSDTITITTSTDLRSTYADGRQMRITDENGSSTGRIASTTYSSPTLTINMEGGMNITGSTISKVELGIPAFTGGGTGIDYDDDVKIRFGDGNDLQIWHDGSNSYIKDNGTGDLVVQGSDNVKVQNAAGADMAKFTSAGAVELYHNGSKKLETTSAGVTVTGTVTGNLAAAYPVGSIYMNASNSTNPATLLGFGTWAAFGAGRMPVGINSGDSDFDTAEETGGAKTHTLTTAQMPSHDHYLFADYSHEQNANQDWVRVNNSLWSNGDGHAAGKEKSAAVEGYQASGSDDFKYRIAYDTNNATPSVHPSSNTGSGSATNHMNPYIVVYMWKRTA